MSTWRTDDPPNMVCVQVKCSDFRGEYTMSAMRKDYKKPQKGRKWRWVHACDEKHLTRKEQPEAWRHYEWTA